MNKLHRANIPTTHNFPHIKDWLASLDKDWPISDGVLQTARKLLGKLLQTSKPDVLLHGDLHHDNILQNGDDWLVIDPKGVIGEPAYEVVAFVRNPMPELLHHANAPHIIHKSRQSALLQLLNYDHSEFLIGVLCKRFLHGFGLLRMGVIQAISNS